MFKKILAVVGGIIVIIAAIGTYGYVNSILQLISQGESPDVVLDVIVQTEPHVQQTEILNEKCQDGGFDCSFKIIQMSLENKAKREFKNSLTN